MNRALALATNLFPIWVLIGGSGALCRHAIDRPALCQLGDDSFGHRQHPGWLLAAAAG